MKSFIISIHPEWVASIFNGKKICEIRKDAPKEWIDYLSGKTKIKPEPMIGYIYCTHGKILRYDKEKETSVSFWTSKYNSKTTIFAHEPMLNGKVIAKFTLREVEEITRIQNALVYYKTATFYRHAFNRACYLTSGEITEYLQNKKGYAWHISDLVIFNEPKHLSDFMKPNWDKGLAEALLSASKKDAKILEGDRDGVPNYEELTMQGYIYDGMVKRPPQSWQYVEVRE